MIWIFQFILSKMIAWYKRHRWHCTCFSCFSMFLAEILHSNSSNLFCLVVLCFSFILFLSALLHSVVIIETDVGGDYSWGCFLKWILVFCQNMNTFLLFRIDVFPAHLLMYLFLTNTDLSWLNLCTFLCCCSAPSAL